jgi:hypothetical protein
MSEGRLPATVQLRPNDQSFVESHFYKVKASLKIFPVSRLDGLNLDAHFNLVFFHFPRLSDLFPSCPHAYEIRFEDQYVWD